MSPSVTRTVGSVLPARLYHWLVVRVARLPLTPARVLHSVVFRHPLHPRAEHYIVIPTEYSPTILDLPAPAARNLEEDIREWVAAAGWRYVLVVANFGAYQETPFLHVHLMPGETPPENALTNPDWLTVELEEDAGAIESGRRVVLYDAVHDLAQVTTEVNRR